MFPSVWVCEPSIVTSGGPFGSDGTHDPTETVPITSVSLKVSVMPPSPGAVATRALLFSHNRIICDYELFARHKISCDCDCDWDL